MIGRTEGGMNTNLPAVTDANNRPLNAFMTAGQVATARARRACWTTCQKSSDCSATVATTPIGSGTLSKPRTSSHAARARDRQRAGQI